MYLMNFLFDMGKVKGIFSGDRTAQAPAPGKEPLYASPNWLELAGPRPASFAPGTFDPDTSPWSDLGDMDTATLLISQAAGIRDLGIRIAGDPTGTLFDKTKPVSLKLSVCFGRPSHTKQDMASPLKDAANGVITTIVEVNQAPTGWNARKGSPADSDPYWYFYLGEVKHWPNKPRRSHRYQFSVGAVIAHNGVIRHYSHDPEMDVTT